MLKFVIEHQYLVPMYQHIVVEAQNLEEACKQSITDDIDWDTQEMDSDNARTTTITGAKPVPDGYDASPERSLIIASRDPKGLPLDMLSFATFLYENEPETGRLLEIPDQFTDDKMIRHAPSTAVEGARGVRAVRVMTAARPISS